jgi:hypothetical protein
VKGLQQENEPWGSKRLVEGARESPADFVHDVFAQMIPDAPSF